MQIPTFDEFSGMMVNSLSPNHRARLERSTLVVHREDEQEQELSLDVLYRTYIDLAIQNPEAEAEDLLSVIYDKSNDFEAQQQRAPVFAVREVGNFKLERALMQGCTSVPIGPFPILPKFGVN